jgi:hypothetical protein
MDTEELHRAIMELKPCLAFHDIGPDTLAAIRQAAAQPTTPARIMPIRPLSPEVQAANAELQAYQDWVNEQVAEAMRRVNTIEWSHPFRLDDWDWLR